MADSGKDRGAETAGAPRSAAGISIVIPAFNEEEGIADTVVRCKNLLATLPATPDHEIVVVDDGSTDRTSEILRTLGVKEVRHSRNLGYGKSLKDGIAAARHDRIVMMDADGTYPVEEIPALLASFEQGNHLVIGCRGGGHYHQPRYKQWMRQVLRGIVEFAAGRDIPDVNSGLRLFSKSEITPYLERFCNTFSFTTSQTLAYFLTGKRVAFLPITYDGRKGRTKINLLRDSLRTMGYILRLVAFYDPRKFFVLIGLTVLSVGLLMGICGVLFGAGAVKAAGLFVIACSIAVPAVLFLVKRWQR